MTKKIEITIAKPIDGEGVENINMDKYTDEVLSIISKQIDFPIELDWVSNDGTAETEIVFAGFTSEEEYDLRADVAETVILAEEVAFCNADNYNEHNE